MNNVSAASCISYIHSCSCLRIRTHSSEVQVLNYNYVRGKRKKGTKLNWKNIVGWQ